MNSKNIFVTFTLMLFVIHSLSQTNSNSDTQYYDPVHHIVMTDSRGMSPQKRKDGGVDFNWDGKIYSTNTAIIDDGKRIFYPLNPLKSPYADSPRIHPYHNQEGSYSMVVSQNKEEINPGDIINFQVYFSGYGLIEYPKIFVLPSSDFYDEDYSFSYNDASIDTNYQIIYGIDSYAVRPTHKKAFSLGGAQFADKSGKKWPEFTAFFDVAPFDSINGSIATENFFDKAPYEIHLKTLSNINSGTYSVHFVLTYYDGVKWRNDEKTATFTVNTWPDRNWLLLLILSLIFGGIPVLDWFWKSIKSIGLIRKKLRNSSLPNGENPQQQNNVTKTEEKNNRAPKKQVLINKSNPNKNK